MRRSDIRNGTLFTIIFSIVVFFVIVWLGFYWNQDATYEPSIKTSSVTKHFSFSNSDSDFPLLHPLDNEIESFMRKWEVAGMSLSIVRNDSLLYSKGYGWADRERREEMNPNSIMRIASASKLVTAAAIMKLMEQGKLGLNDKVFGEEGILNDTIFTNAVEDEKIFDITVDHLLQHKGGFTLGAGDPMFNTVEIMEAKKLTEVPTDEELVKIVLGRRIAPPGSGRHYSNFGYKLLSMIIEKRSGMSYWDYVETNLFMPAGTHPFKQATNYYADRHTDEVRYYGPDTVKVREFNGSGNMVERVYGGSNINALAGAGGWVTNSQALARFVASIDGRPEVKDILSKESVELLTQFENDEKMLRGWSEGDGKGKLTRTGTLSSSHTLIQQYPDGECWVLITNSGVWTGFHFSKEMLRLVERLRSKYKNTLPKRNLWGD